ncbi:nitrogen fixation protein NifQ (plasmid) [Rhizobium sp. Pop5]|jgi:nitrogen fixation protein NifQ|uniref:Nitrogen fixation protein n=5 Tax=Rhizobium TaxID=379 RepID=Q8KLE6_RHIEC|nr:MULTISPECIES: nitrogen fixation protein NifQ [Rhizobium]AAM54794.2 nitrogen fixation protein [Rhizobium etli CFN 42]ARO26988.1 nitrogen fixation protein NifQ [Rhizobium sp. TAL182]EJZ16896.1 nitrogen fixation protein [Rhizobium sp. Pop5]KKZ84418.1 nitrogen fixation protein, NifQ [Rhizobium phaseoli Ch24-10]MBB4546051.1 nitrogen fixation protein NifQ [Rhizobium leguminosarum]
MPNVHHIGVSTVAVPAADAARQTGIAVDHCDDCQTRYFSRPCQMGLKLYFDDYVLFRVFSRALEEIEMGIATATEATGLSLRELRDIPARSFPARLIRAFALQEASDCVPDAEEQLLRDMLLGHVRPGDPEGVRFAKIIARRSMREDHLWRDLGLLDKAELRRLLFAHFPALVAGNTNNMRWKKYFYRKICEAEGFSLCSAPSCKECGDFNECFLPEESGSLSGAAEFVGREILKT